MSALVIIISAIVCLCIWLSQMHATHSYSVAKGVLIILLSLCPIVNTIMIIVFIIGRAAGSGDETYYDNTDNVFGFDKAYDPNTRSGRLLIWLTKNR